MKEFKITTIILLIFLLLAGCNKQYTYKSTGSLFVTNGNISEYTQQNGNEVSYSDVAASISLLSTICDILRTDDIYVELSKTLENKHTPKELQECITVSTREDNPLFTDVTVIAKTKEEANVIKLAYLELAPQYITYYIPNTTVKVFS